MDAVTRKSLVILLGILAAEAVPYTLMLGASPPARVLRLYAFDPAIWPAWAAAIAVALAYVLYARRALPAIRARFFEWSPLKSLALPFALVTGTIEEIWFRRMLMDWCAHHGGGAAEQVAVSALVFGVAHGIWGLFGGQWRVAAGATAATGALGALLALVYLLAGRDVAPCIWAHMLINLAIEPWLIVAAVSAGSAGWGRSRVAEPL
jgi:hypothetical protein